MVKNPIGQTMVVIMNIFPGFGRKIDSSSSSEGGKTGKNKGPLGDTPSDAAAMSEDQIEAAKQGINEKRGSKGSSSSSTHQIPAPSDSDAKKGEETTKAVKKFPFPFKKSASGPSKAKEEEEKPHAASEDEIEYISTAIMAHHGLAKGMPIASQAIVHMENINKALGEEIPNVKKAKEELQSLLNTLCLPEEKGKSTLEATTARIHEVEVAYKVLIDLRSVH